MGNLWRYRNEGVEAFNKIVSPRHNKHNGNGGRKRTRVGEPIKTCPDFWSLGQWLGRRSMWQLGYGDDMDPDRCKRSDETPETARGTPCDTDTNSDTDGTYTLSPGHNVGGPYCTDTSSDDESAQCQIQSDDSSSSSVASVEFTPCTPLDLSMMESRSRHLLRRNCLYIS